jgi:hypothetical protein
MRGERLEGVERGRKGLSSRGVIEAGGSQGGKGELARRLAKDVID